MLRRGALPLVLSLLVPLNLKHGFMGRFAGSSTPNIESMALKEMLESSDYLHQGALPVIPECVMYADPLRLQQVFDNIFANSYKYAGTKIDVKVCRNGQRLEVLMEDYGGGVCETELPLLKEKFKRGSNAKNVEGAGLGLYISDRFLTEMGGCLCLENGAKGLRAVVRIAFSGTA